MLDIPEVASNINVGNSRCITLDRSVAVMGELRERATEMPVEPLEMPHDPILWHVEGRQLAATQFYAKAGRPADGNTSGLEPTHGFPGQPGPKEVAITDKIGGAERRDEWPEVVPIVVLGSGKDEVTTLVPRSRLRHR